MSREKFYCSNFQGEQYSHDDFQYVITNSAEIWMTHKIADAKQFTLSVVEYFKKENWICILALSACPLIVKTEKHLRIILSLPWECHILPDCGMELVQLGLAPNECGYREEEMLVVLLEISYKQNWNELAFDVERAYQLALAKRCVSPALRYMHNRVCKSSRLPPYINLITMLPYQHSLHNMVKELVKFVMDCSSLKNTFVISYILTKPLMVSSDAEFYLIEKLRSICGFKWHRKYTKHVNLKFGSTQWKSEWNSTFVSNKDTCYFERYEERIVWVSAWLAGVRSHVINLQDTPKMLLVRMSLLLI